MPDVLYRQQPRGQNGRVVTETHAVNREINISYELVEPESIPVMCRGSPMVFRKSLVKFRSSALVSRTTPSFVRCSRFVRFLTVDLV